MTDKAHYIIQKQILDIRHSDRGDAFSRQIEIGKRYRQEVVPLLEKVCRELCPGDQLVKIDTLVLDLPPMTENSYRMEWAGKVVEAFRENLLHILVEAREPQQQNVRVISRADAGLRMLASFLHTGVIPWWHTENKSHTPEAILRELMAEEPAVLKRFLVEGLEQASFAKRLCHQFSSSLIMELFFLLEPSHAEDIRKCYHALHQHLEKTVYTNSRNNTVFLLNYHSLRQLAAFPYRNKKRFTEHIIRRISQAWKVDYKNLLYDMLQALAPAPVQNEDASFFNSLEILYGEAEAVSKAQKTIHESPELTEYGGHVPADEKQLLTKSLRTYFEPFIRHIEEEAPTAKKIYESLVTEIDRMLQEFEPDEEIPGTTPESLLEKFGQQITDQNDMLHPEMIPQRYFHRELQELLRELRAIKEPLGNEKPVLYKNIRERFEALIRQIREEASAAKLYESLVPEIGQLLKETGPQEVISKTTLESLETALESLLEKFGQQITDQNDMLHPEMILQRYFHRAFRDLLRELKAIKETPDDEKPVLYKTIRERFEMLIRQLREEASAAKLYESLVTEIGQLLKETGPQEAISGTTLESLETALEMLLEKSGWQIMDRNDAVHPEVIPKRYFHRELRELLKELERISNASVAEKTSLHKTVKKRLHGFMRILKSHVSEAATAHENLMTSAGQLLRKPDPVTETSAQAFERLKVFLENISENEEDIQDRHQDLDIPGTEAIYLQNAGVVILWPFFTQLFEELQLTEKHRFSTEEKQYRAVHLLQYLANKEEHCGEHRLSLNKLLCGLPLYEPIPRQLTLLSKEKEAVEDLIRAAIEHWPMMKNTSVEGLREAFLIREGKLSRNNNGWLLQVTQKSYDMIMDKLPWAISLVKLPWMPEPLFLEW